MTLCADGGGGGGALDKTLIAMSQKQRNRICAAIKAEDETV